MKKSVVVLFAVIALAVVSSYVVSAQDQPNGMMNKKEMMGKGEMMDKGKMGMCPMHMAACESMLKAQMAATDDGGVIILACNKLMKYDKELNLVKEVELKIDMSAEMKKMMDKCQSMCPMPQKKMEMGQEMKDTSKGDM